MNNSIYRISLDIHDTNSQTSLSAKRGDTARSIYITLTENGKPYKIAEGCYAVFRMKKPADDNGNRAIVYNDCTIKDNAILYSLISSNTEVVGVAECETTLYGADGRCITSPHFTLVIEDTLVTDGEVESVGQNELSALVTATSEAKAITAEVEQKLANGDFVGAKGDKGDKGDQGLKGDKGAPFTYTDFTAEQLESLRGPQGVQGPRGLKGDTYALTDTDKTDIAALVLANFTDVSEVGQ